MSDTGSLQIFPDGREPEPTPIAPSEAAALMRGADSGPIEVNCPDGRKITCKRLGWLDQARLARVLGPELSANEQYLGIATLAFMVTHIDGKPVAAAVSAEWIEARMQQLGDEGIDAIANHLATMAQEMRERRIANAASGQPAPDAEEAYRARVKNS